MTTEEKIAQMYDKQLQNKKELLKTDFDSGNEKLDVQKQEIQKQAQKNVDAVRVDAAKRAFNAAELENAAGLTSGARAQASLSRGNQLQSNVTQIRAAEQEADAQLERQRALFAKEYADAIRQAQAENDLAKAEALYAQAQAEDAALAQAKKAETEQQRNEQLAYAKYLADNGDTSYWEELLGIKRENTVEADMQALLQAYPSKTITNYQDWKNAVDDYGINTLKKYGFSSGYFNTQQQSAPQNNPVTSVDTTAVDNYFGDVSEEDIVRMENAGILAADEQDGVLTYKIQDPARARQWALLDSRDAAMNEHDIALKERQWEDKKKEATDAAAAVLTAKETYPQFYEKYKVDYNKYVWMLRQKANGLAAEANRLGVELGQLKAARR